MLHKPLVWLILTTSVAWAQSLPPAPAESRPAAELMDAPAQRISNGLVTAKIYLPGEHNSFYQGTRFDAFGTVGSLIVGGQEFYGPWFDKTADVRDFIFTQDGIVAGPESADAGPVEEFNADGKALGFDTAPPGGTFIKIGVGVLRRPDDKAYDRYRVYTVVDAGKRHTAARKDRITFTQQIFDANTGYGYSYVKVLRLVPGKPTMVIEHVLKNTGKKAFTTQVYDHNFLTMSSGNANLVITVPFAIKPPVRLPPAGVARVEGNSITYLRPMTGQDRASVQIAGFGPGSEDYSFRIANTRTGASIEVRGDQPLKTLSLFSIRTTAAVEPTISMDLAPGAEKRWSYTYTYTAPKTAP